MDYYSHIFYWGMNRGGPGNDPTHDLWENDREVWLNGQYLTEVIRDRAVAYDVELPAGETPVEVAFNGHPLSPVEPGSGERYWLAHGILTVRCKGGGCLHLRF